MLSFQTLPDNHLLCYNLAINSCAVILIIIRVDVFSIVCEFINLCGVNVGGKGV